MFFPTPSTLKRKKCIYFKNVDKKKIKTGPVGTFSTSAYRSLFEPEVSPMPWVRDILRRKILHRITLLAQYEKKKEGGLKNVCKN